MKYADKYLQVPAFLQYDLKGSGLDKEGVPLAEFMIVESIFRFSIMDLSAYSPDTAGDFPADDEALTCTRIFLKGGISFLCAMGINDFEELLNAHYQKIYNNDNSSRP